MGEGTFVRHGSLELAVFRLEPGEQSAGPDARERIFVIDNSCPHAGGNLSAGEVSGSIVTCGWHQWSFDLETGACADSPRARARVRRYPATIRDGIIFADLESARP